MAPVVLCTVLTVATGLAAAARQQDLEVVRQAAQQFVVDETRALPGRVTVVVQPPDNRLRLAACASLQPYVPPGVRLWGRSSVGVRCSGPDTWSMTLTVFVKVEGTAVLTARPVTRGQRITEADIAVRPADLTQLPAGVLTTEDQALGKYAGVSVAPGLPVRADMLHGERVVQAGETVRIVYQAEGLQVTTEGKALGSGAVGDEVSVRASTGKVIRGTISAPGVVQVH